MSSMNEKVALLGAGPHASVIVDIIEKQGRYEICGFIDSEKEIGSDYYGYEIIGRQEEINLLRKRFNFEGLIICIGDNWLRNNVALQVKLLLPKIRFINAIHPSAIIGKNVRIGAGVVIMAGSIINTGAIIGDHCILNSRSCIEHHCILEDFSSLAPGVTTGGFVVVKKFAAVALGVTIFDRVVIGEHTVIGSGALVTKNIPELVVAYGSPAQVIRQRKKGEKYLK